MTPSNVVEKVLNWARQEPDLTPFPGYSYEAIGTKICGLSEQLTGPRVAVICPQGPEAYISMLGVLHSGFTYSPVNIAAPIDRQIDLMQNFSPTDVIFATDELREEYARHSFFSDKNILSIDRIEAANLSPPRASSLPAYVMFTSGSTGKPKGVVISRVAMDHFVNWGVAALKLCHESRVSQHPNIAFDLSVFDIFVTLSSGAKSFPLVRQIDRLMPARFIKENGLTHWISVPSVIDLMMKDPASGKDAFDTLRMMIFCGEPLLPRHLEFIFSLNPNVCVLNTYGPTEATVCMTETYLNNKNWKSFCATSTAIGNPIPGMEFDLVGGVDSSQGEIFIKGIQVADGYWNDPEQSVSRFRDGGYYTGDWARKIGDNVYFEARIDRQIKINGFRVELSEVEDTLSKYVHGAVACVFVNQEIIAYVEDFSEEVETLRVKIQEDLPSYMRPHKIKKIDCLPRSVNDKVDYKKIEELSKEIGVR